MSTLPVVFGHCFSHDSKMSQTEPRVISTQFPCCHILPNAQSINYCHKDKYKSGKCVFDCPCAWCKHRRRRMAQTSFALSLSKLQKINSSFSWRDSFNMSIKRSIAAKNKQTKKGYGHAAMP